MTQAQSYEAWRITYQSDEQAARSAFDTAEMLRQELLMARAAITSLERDVSQALTERDDATDFIDKILDEVLGQDRHEWTSAYDWDDALADVEVKMAALKSGKCLHQIAEPATAGTAVRAFRDYLGVHDGIKLGGQAMDDMALDLARIALDFKHLVEPRHPDDAAVDALAVLMKAKLAKQRAKGCGGWDTDCTQERLSDLLRTHVNKGDPVDVANFCAFLAARGEMICLTDAELINAMETRRAAEPQRLLAVTQPAPQAVQPAVPVPDSVLTTIGWLLDDAMNAAVKNGANSISMPDDYVALAAWLAGVPAHPAEGVPATATVPEAIDPGQCAQDVFDNGVSVGLFDIPKATANALCAAISAATGARLDWHYIAGRVHMKALAATQPAAQGMEADLTDEQIDEAFNQMPDGAAGFLKSWGYRQFARAVLAAQAKQGEKE